VRFFDASSTRKYSLQLGALDYLHQHRLSSRETLDRPFRLPTILVGDGRLGGISSTLSAYETLLLRGYDVSAVILEDRCLSNDKFLLSYLRNR
jgi:hypothetical protein